MIKYLILLLSLVASVSLIEDVYALNQDIDINVIDIDFDRDTKDIFISWDFGDRYRCIANTEIYINDEEPPYQYRGYYKELGTYTGWFTTTDDSTINCTDKITLNFSDFLDTEPDRFGIWMSFFIIESQFEINKVDNDKIAEASLFYIKNSMPIIYSCDDYIRYDSPKKFVDIVIGPHKSIKTVAENLSCMSVQSIVEYPDAPDTTPPDKPIISARDALFIHGTSEVDAIVSLYLDGNYIGETKSNGEWQIPISLSIGTHTVVVYATDAAGNKSEGTTKQYTIKERTKTDSTSNTTNSTTTNHTGTTDNNHPYIVTPKVTPENVKPGMTFTATCEEDHPDPKYIWHVAIYDSHPVDMKKPYAQGMVKKSLKYTIPSDYSINQIVVTCWASLMDGTSHNSITNSKILSWIVPETDTDVKKKKNGACADCTPPTLGSTKNFDRVVDDGFSYNGNTVQVEKWYTDFPLINATVGIPNLVEIKVYENTGITNMKWVQFCLGAEDRGQSLDSCEVLIEVHLQTFGTTTDIAVQEIVINDKDNLIENDTVTAVSYVVTCMDESPTQECVKVDLDYTYREETINHMMIVNVADKKRNSQNFHFNEGVNVLGESVNESPTITLFDKHTSQQKDNLHITYTRIDKITDTWTDQNGIEYHRINDVTFDRITPDDSYECKDPTLDKVKVWKRTNCHFRALTSLWSYN